MHFSSLHRLLLPFVVLAFCTAIPVFADLPVQPITVALAEEVHGTDLPAQFLGLSMEMSELLPANGHYYFDTADEPLVQTNRRV